MIFKFSGNSSCFQYKTRLVFFDNVYMYNPEKLNPMTEETEILPSSEKGKVRAKIAQMILVFAFRLLNYLN